MGNEAFNIFDSIYVGSMEEYKVAERLVMEEFGKYGIRPTINAERYCKDSKYATGQDDRAERRIGTKQTGYILIGIKEQARR